MEEYQKAREAMLAITMAKFPPGTRVRPIGVTTGRWGATVRELGEYERRALAADMVILDWDNGNRFAVSIEEIEAIK